MNTRAKGQRNQRKSRDYMIQNPQIYGYLDKTRIEIVRGGIGSEDFFGIVYEKQADKGKVVKTIAFINEDTNDTVIANKYENPDKHAGFDIISIPYPDTQFPNHIYLIQVKTNKMPNYKYIKALIDIPFPDYVKKQLHVWNDRKSKPDIYQL